MHNQNIESVEDATTLFKATKLPQRQAKEYDEVDPSMAINNLSPLRRERLEKHTIKIKQRSDLSISRKEAVRMVKASDNWDILKKDYKQQNSIVNDALKAAHYFAKLPLDVLALTNITPAMLRTYLSDIQYFTNKLVTVKVMNDSGKVTPESFLRYNIAMTELDSLAEDTLKILVPMSATMYVAQAIINKHYKGLNSTTNTISGENK